MGFYNAFSPFIVVHLFFCLRTNIDQITHLETKISTTKTRSVATDHNNVSGAGGSPEPEPWEPLVCVITLRWVQPEVGLTPGDTSADMLDIITLHHTYIHQFTHDHYHSLFMYIIFHIHKPILIVWLFTSHHYSSISKVICLVFIIKVRLFCPIY